MSHTPMYTLRQTLARDLERLQAQLAAEMRGRMIPTTKASRLRNEIAELTRQIDALDRDAAQRLALEKAPINEVLEVIAIPLLADVMNDLVAGVDAMLLRNGCSGTVFSDYTNQIRRASLKIIDTLANADEHLPDLLSVDDTLVEAVKKKLMSFIRQRLHITK